MESSRQHIRIDLVHGVPPATATMFVAVPSASGMTLTLVALFIIPVACLAVHVKVSFFVLSEPSPTKRNSFSAAVTLLLPLHSKMGHLFVRSPARVPGTTARAFV